MPPMFSTAMPDFEMTVECIMSEGDKVVFWVSFSCTQIGHGIIQQLGVILARKKKRNRNRNRNTNR
jgi:predicted ester cyclase